MQRWLCYNKGCCHCQRYKTTSQHNTAPGFLKLASFISSLLFLAIPAEFTKPLGIAEAKEGETVTLTCEYSLPGVVFHWSKGLESIRTGDKYIVKQRRTFNSLTIRDLSPEDSGDYTCQCRDHRTTASLKVHGTIHLILFCPSAPKPLGITIPFHPNCHIIPDIPACHLLFSSHPNFVHTAIEE